MPRTVSTLPKNLQSEIIRAGYFPSLVTQIIEVALGGEPPLNYLVQAETTFDETIHRHLTVLVLTPTRLIAGHVDDDEAEDDEPPMAMGTTEAIPLHQIRAVGLTHVISHPASAGSSAGSGTGLNAGYKAGPGAETPTAELAELNLAISWGGVSRLEFGPASCGDPGCEGEHGFMGAAVPDDLVVRVAAAAEGPEATAKALEFARALSAATAIGTFGSAGFTGAPSGGGSLPGARSSRGRGLARVIGNKDDGAADEDLVGPGAPPDAALRTHGRTPHRR